MEGDRARWDARWDARWAEPGGPGDGGGASPDPWLMARAAELPPGPILDVAAGDGRHAIPLAAAGRDVTALDVSGVALARLALRAAALGLAVGAVEADLDGGAPGAAPAGLRGPFAGLVIARYKPSPAGWARLAAALAPGGRALLLSFGRARHARDGFPMAYGLDEAKLRAALGPLGLACRRYDRLDPDGSALEGSVWERGSDG